MRYVFCIFFFINALLQANTAQSISNTSSKEMLCLISYPAVNAYEIIHDINQSVRVHPQLQESKVLKVNEILTPKRQANITCYNEFLKINMHANGRIQESNSRSLDMHVKNHELFDITSYINENKSFIDAKYGNNQKCTAYQDGQYCQRYTGLDVLYRKDERVKKIFIYGRALNAFRNKSAFGVDSFNQLNADNLPLGLWVSDKNKKLIKNKPSFISSNTIIWKNPSKGIKNIVMIAQEGHLPINRYGPNKAKKTEPKDHLQAIEVEYTFDDRAYALHQKTRPMPVSLERNRFNNNQVKPKLPKKAKSTWGKTLNPKNIIPNNKFQAFYINTNYPKKVIASETVAKARINYNGSDFHGIKSEDFGAYWVGIFDFKSTQKMQIQVSQSWSKTRIIIDGMVIYEDGHNSQGLAYTFTKGKHKVEVEYINNWHTTNFMVNIQAKQKLYSRNELKQTLKKISSKNSKLYLVGAYESSKKDQSIRLNIAKSKTPIVLVLSNNNVVDWIIKNPHKVKIEAIIISSRKVGVDIHGADVKANKIIRLREPIGTTYRLNKTCNCHGGATFHCEGQDGLDTLQNIERIIGKKVNGFSGKYRTSDFMVPSKLIDAKMKKQLHLEKRKNEYLQKSCQKKKDPQFENIFD